MNDELLKKWNYWITISSNLNRFPPTYLSDYTAVFQPMGSPRLVNSPSFLSRCFYFLRMEARAFSIIASKLWN